VNGRTILGLQMASKVFIIICDVELGKPPKLPESPGIDPVRANDGLWGRGFGKERMPFCNERYRGSKFALTRDFILIYQKIQKMKSLREITS